uniref:Uncharacterized protein n=1 Tax=Rhizophora mucronata TaxID=61149 RepID=A0A2P2J798_RHIMU
MKTYFEIWSPIFKKEKKKASVPLYFQTCAYKNNRHFKKYFRRLNK